MGSSDNNSEITVPSMNRPSGSQMRGKRNFSPQASSAANESASRIWDGAIPTMIAAAEPNVSQRALRNNIGS